MSSENLFFTLTQNALVDADYQGYVRRMYGTKIYVTDGYDAQKCFQEYLADAGQRLEHDEKYPDEPKQLKPGEEVKLVNDRIQASGQIPVMSVNASLAKIIFDRNPEREFYVEESFPLDWMYPHLSPHGPIMKINRQPLASLSESVVQGDRDYWMRAIRPLIGDWLTYDTSIQAIVNFVEKTYPSRANRDIYLPNDAVAMWASKLRSSQAGVYAWRAQQATDDLEKARMTREADFAFRQALAICPQSPEAVYRYVNLALQGNRWADALLVAETAARVQPDGEAFPGLIKSLKDAQPK